MDGNYRPYDWTASSQRIHDILNQPVGAFQEVDGLPDRDKLTFTNGFYGTCSALFIDIRDSSGLTTKHKRPTLAKIYRAFISEMVALLNADILVREVNIVGDCVWAVYNTPLKSHIDDIFDIAYRANTLIKLLNHHYGKKNIDPLRIGIGLDWGRAAMIKAGYSGSGINDVVYMGDVVNHAAHLSHEAGRQWRKPIFVSSDFQSNLNDHNKSLLTQEYISGLGQIYSGEVIHIAMNNWVDSLT